MGTDQVFKAGQSYSRPGSAKNVQVDGEATRNDSYTQDNYDLYAREEGVQQGGQQGTAWGDQAITNVGEVSCEYMGGDGSTQIGSIRCDYVEEGSMANIHNVPSVRGQVRIQGPWRRPLTLCCLPGTGLGVGPT